MVTLEAQRDSRLISAQRAPEPASDPAPALVPTADALAAALMRDARAHDAVAAACAPGAVTLGDAATPPALRPGHLRALAESMRPEALQRARELAAASGGGSGFAAEAARSTVLAAALEGRPPSASELAEALDAAERAVDSDPLAPEPRLALAWCLLMERRFDSAAEEFALAAHLNPVGAALQREAAFGLALAGRAAEARGLAAGADALDPARADGPDFLPGLISVALGDLRATPPDDPGAPLMARAWRAAALAEAGDPAAAAKAVRALARGGVSAEEAVLRALPLRDPERYTALRRGLVAALEAARDGSGL
jgi:tetratricopeptide (TPR) repeat protein